MEQYLEALRGREDVTEEQITELEERFKPKEVEIPDIEEPVEEDLKKRIEELERAIDELTGGAVSE